MTLWVISYMKFLGRSKLSVHCLLTWDNKRNREITSERYFWRKEFCDSQWNIDPIQNTMSKYFTFPDERDLKKVKSVPWTGTEITTVSRDSHSGVIQMDYWTRALTKGCTTPNYRVNADLKKKYCLKKWWRGLYFRSRHSQIEP